jgi:hypothetical protein
MNRRDFNKVLGAVGVSLVAGARAMAQDKKAAGAPKADAKKADDKAPKHVCKGMNDCHGQGGCATGEGGAAGKNSCKGKGGCATTPKHECRGKNDCKGQGGCGTKEAGCQGKNDCKGKGGCAVPIKETMKKKAEPAKKS